MAYAATTGKQPLLWQTLRELIIYIRFRVGLRAFKGGLELPSPSIGFDLPSTSKCGSDLSSLPLAHAPPSGSELPRVVPSFQGPCELPNVALLSRAPLSL